MEEVHRKAIQRNFVSLIETTDLDSMVTSLYERGVFSERMIEPYKDTAFPQRDRKLKLYLDITRRGPQAFGNLLEVLRELGYWDLVRDLDPNSSLHLRPHRTTNAPPSNYVTFEHNIEKYRSGVDVDCKNLKYLFHELGLKVRSYTNLTLEANVRCSDGGLLSLREIISYFNNQRLPQLSHVPKVFIFQMCRGESTDYVWSEKMEDVPRPAHLSMPETDGTPTIPGSSPPPRRRPGSAVSRPLDKTSFYSNILIAQSTLPGFVSRRDKKLGSWYIQALCSVFAERAHDTHVDKLFTLVDKRLEELFQIQTSSVDRWGFNQRLYLHPGLHE
ncbi:Caspase [Operophtera brumata]|uniref:Caspase n=1 Tax=Operophtera brumata TaxID=104452 RepID=A0A0L7LJ92_OPEBR|nr:Caspase [Operophtera brumata]